MQSGSNTHRGKCLLLKLQLSRYLEASLGVNWNSLLFFEAKVASSILSRCSPKFSDQIFTAWSLFTAWVEIKWSFTCLHTYLFRLIVILCVVKQQEKYVSVELGLSSPEQQHYHIKSGHLLAEEKTIGSRTLTQRAARMARRLKQALFPAQRDALWYSLSSSCHRRPLWCGVIGFTHDDGVERSDPAFVEVSSFLIIASGRKSLEKFSFATTRRVTSRGPDTGHGLLVPAERWLPACHYSCHHSLTAQRHHLRPVACWLYTPAHTCHSFRAALILSVCCKSWVE